MTEIEYEIYEPREDSYLILKEIKEHARGLVLDMGTGSGVLAREASQKANHVIGVDINQSAINYCRETYKDIANLEFYQSDLFSCFEQYAIKFDLIIFNPPYLPLDEREPEDSRLATTGGKKGHELLERFFEQASRYIKKDGKILVLFSSLTGQDKVHSIIESCGFNFQKLAEDHIFQETLFVYLAEKSPLLKHLEQRGITEIHQLAKGHRGVIFTGILEGKKIAVKIQRRDIDVTTSVMNEARWLNLLNRRGIGPKLLHIGKGYFIYEFVEGEFIPDFLEKADKQSIKKVIKEVLDQCFTLDSMNINKLEMHHPYKHIIVKDNIPVMIDFERVHWTENTKNVTQFCQYVSSAKIMNILKKKGFSFKKTDITSAASRYKRNVCKEALRDIKNLID